MELLYAIADYLEVPNEFVVIDSVSDDLVWFHVKSMRYTCKTTRNGKFLKKHSIRRDF